MARAERFEELLAWQKARLLTKEIYELSRGAPLSNDYGLIRQMQRAAVSVMSNIAEGFDRTGSGEFHRFLSIAKGSCGELRSQLYVAFDAGYIDRAPCKARSKRLTRSAA
jgi:four helix bundle protein